MKLNRHSDATKTKTAILESEEYMRKILLMLALIQLIEAQIFRGKAFAIEDLELKTAAGAVKFTAIGKPGFLKIRGDSKDAFPAGKLMIKKHKASGEFSFVLDKLQTGISLRDEHMKKKYLEVDKFPEAKVTLAEITLPASDLADSKGTFSGKLNLHGVTKEISGKYTFSSKSKKIDAEFEIKVSDFKIEIPKYLGITVSESVQIEVEIKL